MLRAKPVPLGRRAFICSGVGLAASGIFGSCGCAAEATPLADVEPLASPSQGYSLHEIGGGLYWVTDGAYSTMFAVSSEGVIACDAPPTLGSNYLKAIAEVTRQPIRYLVYSHEHVDHIAAAFLFPSSVTVVASRRTAELLASRRDTRRRMPDIVFDDQHTLSLGDQSLELSWRGINHSIDNTFIYAPKHRVLMFVDVIYPGWMPYKNLGVAVDIPGFVEAHRTVLSFDFETLVAGHVSRPGTRADVVLQLDFLHDLADACERAYGALPFAKFLAANLSSKSGWDRHNDYENALVHRVAADVASRWRDRLEGFDTYLYDNCWAMLEAFVVHGKPLF
jgi:glyoxylase-like metal-dependent hydrolase (beta-lactamase superfamily II)